MKKQIKNTALTSIQQIIETNSVKAANKFLESKDWILISTYKKKYAYGSKPIYCLGKLKNEDI